MGSYLWRITQPIAEAIGDAFLPNETTPPPSPIPKFPKATRIRDFDRTFILFGKVNSGKSTLGNLLMGARDRPHFETHPFLQPYGLTKIVQSGTNSIDACIVHGEGCQEREPLKIQILDQPGSNDCDFEPEKYGKFLMQCIAEARSEMSVTFLILIDPNSKYFSTRELLTFLNIAEILSNSHYSFFPNATIVFTHTDLLVEDSEETPEEKLREKLKEENYSCINELVNLVDQRYIFINGTNYSEMNRNAILKKLFELTRPNLNVYINGNNGFNGSEMKTLLGADVDAINIKENSLKYDIEYHFNPDINLFRKFDKFNLEAKIGDILNKLNGIGRGISVMVLLISLEEMFTEEIYNLIINIPDTYNLGEVSKKDFWDYACIIFKSPVDKEDVVISSVQGNRLLAELARNVKSRFTWVTERTPSAVCSERMQELVRKVKYDTEGKTYIDSFVLGEINEMIQESVNQRYSSNRKAITTGIDNKDLLRVGLPFFKTNTKVCVSVNDFFWNREYISPNVGYFILKSIDAEVANKFREKYSDQKLTTKEYSTICLKALKKV